MLYLQKKALNGSLVVWSTQLKSKKMVQQLRYQEFVDP